MRAFWRAALPVIVSGMLAGCNSIINSASPPSPYTNQVLIIDGNQVDLSDPASIKAAYERHFAALKNKEYEGNPPLAGGTDQIFRVPGGWSKNFLSFQIIGYEPEHSLLLYAYQTTLTAEEEAVEKNKMDSDDRKLISAVASYRFEKTGRHAQETVIFFDTSDSKDRARAGELGSGTKNLLAQKLPGGRLAVCYANEMLIYEYDDKLGSYRKQDGVSGYLLDGLYESAAYRNALVQAGLASVYRNGTFDTVCSYRITGPDDDPKRRAQVYDLAERLADELGTLKINNLRRIHDTTKDAIQNFAARSGISITLTSGRFNLSPYYHLYWNAFYQDFYAGQLDWRLTVGEKEGSGEEPWIIDLNTIFRGHRGIRLKSGYTSSIADMKVAELGKDRFRVLFQLMVIPESSAEIEKADSAQAMDLSPAALEESSEMEDGEDLKIFWITLLADMTENVYQITGRERQVTHVINLSSIRQVLAQEKQGISALIEEEQKVFQKSVKSGPLLEPTLENAEDMEVIAACWEQIRQIQEKLRKIWEEEDAGEDSEEDAQGEAGEDAEGDAGEDAQGDAGEEAKGDAGEDTEEDSEAGTEDSEADAEEELLEELGAVFGTLYSRTRTVKIARGDEIFLTPEEQLHPKLDEAAAEDARVLSVLYRKLYENTQKLRRLEDYQKACGLLLTHQFYDEALQGMNLHFTEYAQRENKTSLSGCLDALNERKLEPFLAAGRNAGLDQVIRSAPEFLKALGEESRNLEQLSDLAAGYLAGATGEKTQNQQEIKAPSVYEDGYLRRREILSSLTKDLKTLCEAQAEIVSARNQLRAGKYSVQITRCDDQALPEKQIRLEQECDRMLELLTVAVAGRSETARGEARKELDETEWHLSVKPSLGVPGLDVIGPEELSTTLSLVRWDARILEQGNKQSFAYSLSEDEVILLGEHSLNYVPLSGGSGRGFLELLFDYRLNQVFRSIGGVNQLVTGIVKYGNSERRILLATRAGNTEYGAGGSAGPGAPSGETGWAACAFEKNHWNNWNAAAGKYKKGVVKKVVDYGAVYGDEYELGSKTREDSDAGRAGEKKFSGAEDPSGAEDLPEAEYIEEITDLMADDRVLFLEDINCASGIFYFLNFSLDNGVSLYRLDMNRRTLDYLATVAEGSYFRGWWGDSGDDTTRKTANGSRSLILLGFRKEDCVSEIEGEKKVRKIVADDIYHSQMYEFRLPSSQTLVQKYEKGGN